MRVWIVVGALVSLVGCATRAPLKQSAVDLHDAGSVKAAPDVVHAQLLAFHAALLDTPGVDAEPLALITAWIADGVRIRQAQPRQWEGQARLRWPLVRSLIGPYDGLQGFATTFDRLLQ